MDAIQIAQLASNLAVALVGIKIIRHLSRMELKVEMMWKSFARRMGINTENESDY